MHALANNIKRLRYNYELTQKDLAKKIDTTQQHFFINIYKKEKRGRLISFRFSFIFNSKSHYLNKSQNEKVVFR